MSPVSFLPSRLLGFYEWSIFVRSWTCFFWSHFGFSSGFCRFGVLCGFVVGHCRFWLLWMWVLYLDSSWLIRGHPFREGEDASLRPSVYRILVINCVAVSEQYVVELSRPLHFRWLSRIFAVTIRWSDDTSSKEEHASQFIALFFQFLSIETVVYLHFTVLRVCVRPIVFPVFFDSLLTEAILVLGSIMKSVRCCPFLFNVLCRLVDFQNVCFSTDLGILYLPPMISRFCFRNATH